LRATPNLDFTSAKLTETWLRLFVEMVKKIYQNLTNVINGNLGFGDGTNADNINGVWSNVTAPGAPNTDFTITHNLGRIPVGYWVMQADRATDIYTGSVAATKTQLTLRSSVASAVLRIFIVCLILSLLAFGATAQTTNLTIQVTDTGSQSWNNGTWSVVLVSPPGAIPFGPPFNNIGTTTPVPNQTQSGSLSATGSATMTLTQNTGITPTNSQWRFTVCSQATSPCFTQFVTVTATTTATITPPVILVQAGPNAVAYADSEVVAGVGGTYYNVTLIQQRICQVVTGATCTTWANIGGGGGVSGAAQNPNPGPPWFNVKAYGAKGDGQASVNGVTNGTTTLTCSDCTFTAADVGKQIAGTFNYSTQITTGTTITGFTNSTTITMSNTIGALSGISIVWCTPDDTAIANAVTAAVAAMKSITSSGNLGILASAPTLYFPAGNYCLLNQYINIAPSAARSGIALIGDGSEITRITAVNGFTQPNFMTWTGSVNYAKLYGITFDGGHTATETGTALNLSAATQDVRDVVVQHFNGNIAVFATGSVHAYRLVVVDNNAGGFA